MLDPMFQALLDAIRHGDAAAQPALADWMVEHDDPRSEAVRTAKRLDAIAELFLPSYYTRTITDRLIAAGNRRFETALGNCYAAHRPRWGIGLPFSAANDVFSLTDAPDLNLSWLLQHSATMYQFANHIVRDEIRPTLIWDVCSFAVAVVSEIEPTLAEALSGLNRSLDWDKFSIPIVYEASTGKLHHYRKVPKIFGKNIYRSCLKMIEKTLSPWTSETTAPNIT